MSGTVLLLLLLGCGRLGFESGFSDKNGPTGDIFDSAYCNDKLSETDHAAFGDGTRKDPYLICTAEQMASIGLSAAGHHHYRLLRTIDMSGFDETNYEPIDFSGVFDGNYNEINNFSYHDPNRDWVGIFGYSESSRSEIRNLGVVNANVTGRGSVGALIGEHFGKITNCHSSGSVSGRIRVGGLAGILTSGLMGTSRSTATVSGQRQVGGLAGVGFIARMANVYATGTVSGASQVGGLIGETWGMSIVNAYASGHVIASGSSAGGLVGLVRTGNDGMVNGFALGDVTCASSGSTCGPVTGSNGSTFENLFYDSAANCTNKGAGSCNSLGTGVDRAANPNYFFTPANAPLKDWDFSSSWQANSRALPTIGVPEKFYLNENRWGDCRDHESDAPFAGGAGTIENPYLICTPTQLQALGADPSNWEHKHYRVMAKRLDLSNLSGTDYNIIGSAAQPFHGSFDGNGVVVEGLEYVDSNTDYVGLFGYVGKATILHVMVKDAKLQGRNYVGALAGRLSGGSVQNVFSSGDVRGNNSIGGVIGAVPSSSWLHGSYSTASVAGNTRVGGVVGNAQSGWVGNSFSIGNVSGATGEVGPVLGDADLASEIPDDDPWWTLYYDSNSKCEKCVSQDSATRVDFLGADGRWFHSRFNPPLHTWDFDNVWVEVPGGLPVLK